MALDVNQYIDHTLLKADADESQILQLCEEAKEHNFAGICIPPYYVKLAKTHLKDSNVLIATVVSFPMGYDHIGSKMDSIKKSIDQGADELDAVINITAIKNGRWVEVESEIDSLITACRIKNKTIKLIIEAALLTPSELDQILEIAIKHKPGFVKTSTGFAVSDNLVELVKYLRSKLPDSIKIKASGGIKDLETAEKLIEAGADRLGTSSAMKILSL
nr:deoxyribose-phosphate aldolase [Saprospiraceae bacterium]